MKWVSRHAGFIRAHTHFRLRASCRIGPLPKAGFVTHAIPRSLVRKGAGVRITVSVSPIHRKRSAHRVNCGFIADGVALSLG